MRSVHRYPMVTGGMSIKSIALAPLYVPQALWVAARASRLPEAPGARQGRCGQGDPRRLMVLGDSSAAGVGASDQRLALGGQLSAVLAQHFSVDWQVVARSGGTTASTLRLLDGLAPRGLDFVTIALGVNDVKNGVRPRAWADRYARLLNLVDEKFAPERVCVSGVPPIRHFPILPWPLNDVLGARAEAFDTQLRALCAERSNVRHLPLDFMLHAAEMAPDNFHPGPKLYRAWAVEIANVLRAP
ncbi:SGNH/GDSL hydrolase family protein [uncultured Tateyamaria sp.]|uniref:SGNH/GDSL hydrolase family protein n=1 Tax=uncultured Tateyamaria sp. TaxID=455651 RepID=UPI002605E458|nr:SGNH/GDSL hydrolase family protein [uncultured Tateyamaria sp.]